MKATNSVFAKLGTTIFESTSRQSAAVGAINLGQGFPDGNGPDDVRAKAVAYLADGPNQYPPLAGVPELCDAIAAHSSRFYGLAVDPTCETLVILGATEALASCLFALIEPGDEVVLIEPLYDSYLPIVRRAGGVPRLVRLAPPNWTIPRDELAAAFSARTKLLMLNSPMNPTGKVFDVDELTFIASLVERYDAYAVCDEVYEHLLFDGLRHIPLMTLPGMRGRCLCIGSAGKIFSLTGWKVGYVLASVMKAHRFITFTIPPNLQYAVAYGLGKDDVYFMDLAAEMVRKRDFLANGLRELGFGVFETAGIYFICADIQAVSRGLDDVTFCERLTTEAGVTAIPVSAFYDHAPPTNLVRLAFCKEAEALAEGLQRLKKGLAVL